MRLRAFASARRGLPREGFGCKEKDEGGRTLSVERTYEEVRRVSLEQREDFWMEAATLVEWETLPSTAHQNGRWFVDGVVNTCANAVDRHVRSGLGDKTAVIYESPVTGQRRDITYADLLEDVGAFAGGLQSLGVSRGDRVLIYMPMIPEAVTAMLACARIGAVHSVVFGGFAAKELAARIDDLAPRVVVAASCAFEPNRVVDYRAIVEAAIGLAVAEPPERVFVQRDGGSPPSTGEIDWDALMQIGASSPGACVPLAATDPLYVLYTSGTTGQPKGITRDHGGHAVAMAWSMGHLFGCERDDVWWAASDIGWVVGHSYIVYAPLIHGATTVLFEGKPVGTPDASTFARVIEKLGVSGFFTSPSALRAIRKQDPDGRGLRARLGSSLQRMFLAGERLDPATRAWADRVFRVPVIDNWWQTETGWPVAITPVGIQALPPREGSPGVAAPGYDIRVLDTSGQELPPGHEGELCIRLPLPPGAMTTVWGDDARFHASYLSAFPGYYHTGDTGHIDEDGYVFVMGRSDDVINVAGHRLSTGVLEAAVLQHPEISDCAVVGVHDEIKGCVPRAFVVRTANATLNDSEVQRQVVTLVRDEVGPVAALRSVTVVPALPKTRSGKILRRTLRDLADGVSFALPTTIEDPTVVDVIAKLLSTSERQDSQS
jgi:propionyl-CoA synthetase